MLCGLRHPVMFTYCWQLSSKSVCWLCFLESRAAAKPRVICCSCITYSFTLNTRGRITLPALLALTDRIPPKESCLCSRKKLVLIGKGAEECGDDGEEDTMQSVHCNAVTSCCNPIRNYTGPRAIWLSSGRSLPANS